MPRRQPHDLVRCPYGCSAVGPHGRWRHRGRSRGRCRRRNSAAAPRFHSCRLVHGVMVHVVKKSARVGGRRRGGGHGLVYAVGMAVIKIREREPYIVQSTLNEYNSV